MATVRSRTSAAPAGIPVAGPAEFVEVDGLACKAPPKLAGTAKRLVFMAGCKGDSGANPAVWNLLSGTLSRDDRPVSDLAQPIEGRSTDVVPVWDRSRSGLPELQKGPTVQEDFHLIQGRRSGRLNRFGGGQKTFYYQVSDLGGL
jgi:hypothetical protein